MAVPIASWETHQHMAQLSFGCPEFESLLMDLFQSCPPPPPPPPLTSCDISTVFLRKMQRLFHYKLLIIFWLHLRGLSHNVITNFDLISELVGLVKLLIDWLSEIIWRNHLGRTLLDCSMCKWCIKFLHNPTHSALNAVWTLTETISMCEWCFYTPFITT